MEKVKIVIYKRVSTKGQGESGLGLEAQDAYIQHFVTANEKFEVVKEFTEVASAKSVDCKKRPFLCEAVAMCQKQGFTLVVAKVDRLSRTTEHALDIFSKLDGRLISCDIPNLDKFTLTLYMAIADREREMISIRTKQALTAKKERGETWDRNSKWTDEQRQKGKDVLKDNALRNTNTKKSKNYATMLRNEGKTLEQIAEILNEEGFLTARGKSFDKALVKYLIEK